MSTTVHHVSLLTPRVAPLDSRGAQLAAAGFALLCRSIVQAFRGKAGRHALPSRAEEAREVREMAWRVKNTDPGFASDLYAAAARHEGSAG